MTEQRTDRSKRRVLFTSLALALLSIVGSQITAAPGDKEDPEKEERYRTKIPGWVFTQISDGVVDTRKVDVDPDEAMKLIQDKYTAAGEGKTPEQLKRIGEIFEKYHFETIEKIAKAKKLEVPGTKQGSTISTDMGLLRRQMINQAMAEAVKKLDPDGKLTIGMLDSGNKNSGIASDVDQTVFVMPRDVGEKMKPPVTVEKVIEKFNAEFEAKLGCHPERMGIECMNGNDFYPDWRQRHSTQVLGAEARRVVHEKRKNPEAYRSEGELKIQAEGRGHEALQEHHKRVAELEKAKTRIEEIRQGRKQVPAADQARINDLEAKLLSKYQDKYPATSIAELEEKFSRDSPWTEVRNNPEGDPHVSQMQDPKGKVLKVKPELARRFAFDGAWDNWIMYEHHPQNRRKYLLRSIAEGPGLLREIRQGKPLTTFEYEKVYGGHNTEGELKSFLRQTYQTAEGQPRLSDEKVDQFKRCLDVAARERLRHKSAAGFASMTDKQVWGPYWPQLSEKEAKLYSDMPEKALQKMLLDRAVRTWEMDAREIMMENLIRTVTEPAKLLQGPEIRSKAIAKIQAEHPRAKPNMLERAVREQLYAGIHDLISVEHAKEIVADPETKKTLPPRHTDLVDRMLVAVKGTLYEAEVRQIVVDAATARIRVEPGQTGFLRALGSYYWDGVRTRYAGAVTSGKGGYNSTVEAYRNARQKLASGELTAEYVGRQMLQAGGERLGALKMRGAQTYGSWAVNVLGFQPKSFNGLVPVTGELPKGVDLSSRGIEWSTSKFARNIRSPGNADSVLMVMVAYQEKGPEAAAWAAVYEVMFNVPGVAQLNAVNDLRVHHNPQGVVMLGSAMFVPALGHVYIMVNIGKNSVILLGNFVFETLKDDTADLLYQGFLDQEAGLLRAGTKETFRGQRVSLLHFVPIRVIQKPAKKPDGTIITDDNGDPIMTAVWSRYSGDEARDLFTVFPEEYDALVQLGILGGGDEWEQALAEINDIRDPRAHFEAKRASMYYHFRPRIEPLLAPQNLDVHEDEALPIIVEFFLDYLDQWINARGAFDGFDENVLISRRFEVSEILNNQALRTKIATRAARDFIRSYYLVKGSVIDNTSIERLTEMRVRQAREGDLIEEANMIIQAVHEARWVKPDIDMAQAFHALLKANRDLEREEEETGRPYARVRPRVVRVMVPNEEDHHTKVPIDRVEFMVSVVADPNRYPPPYRIETQWLTSSHNLEARGTAPELSDDQKRRQDQDELERIAQGQNTETLSAIVRVYDSNNHEIELAGDQAMPIEIGTLKVPKPQEGTRDLKVAVTKKVQDPGSQVATGTPSTPSGGQGASQQPKPATAQPRPRYETVYEDYDEAKASSWADQWDGQDAEQVSAELWIRWDDCPLDMYYYQETQVTGGTPKYEKKEDGSIGASKTFPDWRPSDSDDGVRGDDDPVPEFESAEDRRNIFIVPFAWPEGHAGSFTIKGRIIALTKHYEGDAWKTEKPFAVYEFEEPFTIVDQRSATHVELMMRYSTALGQGADAAQYDAKFDERGKPLTPARDAVGRESDKHVWAYTDFDHMNATPKGIDWDDGGKNVGGDPQLWINWKDMPPNQRYVFEVKITGGAPEYEWSDYKEIDALRSFPPYDGKPQRGGTCFIIPIRYPVGHAGSFDVVGKLYAFEREQQRKPWWEWRNAVPVATFPFRSYFSIPKVERSGEVSAGMTPMGTVGGHLKLSGIQPGERVAVVSAAGQTCHTIINERFTFKLYRIGKIDELTVTFRDYGQEVTLKLPVRLREDWTPAEVDREAVSKLEQRISQMPEGTRALSYSKLAYCYVADRREPIDFGEFKAAMFKAIDVMRTHMAAAEDEEERKRYRSSVAGYFGQIGGMALAMGNLAEYKQWAEQAEAALVASGGDPKRIDESRIAWLRIEAEMIFQETGNLEAAHALWEQSNAISNAIEKPIDDNNRPRKSPYKLGDLFTTGVAVQDLMRVLQEVKHHSEKNGTTLHLQRGRPDEVRVLLGKGFIELDDIGNYRITPAGTQAMKAHEDAGRPPEEFRQRRRRQR